MSKKDKRRRDRDRDHRDAYELDPPSVSAPVSNVGISPAANSIQSPPSSGVDVVEIPPPSPGPMTRRSTPRPPEGSAPSVALPKPSTVAADLAASVEPGGFSDDDEPVDDLGLVSQLVGTETPEPPDGELRPPNSRRETKPTSVGELEDQIRELESRLDKMIGTRARPEETPPPAPQTPPDADDEVGATSARDLLSSEFYLRQWGRVGMRSRTEDVDEFGLDRKVEARYIPLLDFLYKHYFRVEAEGADRIPPEGRCLIVANHSGGPLPYDGLMLRTIVRREGPDARSRRDGPEPLEPREVRWLAEDFIYYLPFVGSIMNRLGAVRACQENAERLLSRGKLVAVFPEGAKGIGKLYRDRYRLQRFGRGGFIRLCLRTQTPVVPCAIVGAEEANPMLYRVEIMAKALGVPYLPVTPTFPALGPLGLLPAPTKWRVTFGEPIRFDGAGPEAADDDILVGRLTERVRATIQGMLDRSLAERRSIWFG